MGLTVSQKRWLVRGVEVAFLVVVVLLAFQWRMVTYDVSVPESGDHVWFIGTDPYYHWRVVLATVHNFPDTVHFDPFTQFPKGTDTGQFGSLFDQGAAAFALATGQTDRLGVAAALSMFPAVMGAALFVPFYYLARAMLGRPGGAFATVALLLIPGEFLARSLAGYADHHVAEALGMILALLGVYTAVESAHAHRASLRLPRDEADLVAMRAPLLRVGLGSLGVLTYFLFWPPALLVVAIIALWLFVTFVYEHVRGADTAYIALGGGGTLALAGVLLVPFTDTWTLQINKFSLLQVLALVLSGAVFAGLHLVSRRLHARGAHRAVLPMTGVAMGASAFFGVKLLMPGLYGALQWAASWVTGVGVKPEMRTIGEAQATTINELQSQFGILVLLFVLVLFVLPAFIAWRRRRADLLLLIWGFVVLLAGLTQVRFTYYTALGVAMGVGWLVWLAADLTGLNRALDRWLGHEPAPDAADAADGPKPRGRGKGRRGKGAAAAPDAKFSWVQAAAVGIVALVLLPGFVIPATASDGKPADETCARLAEGKVRPAWAYGECYRDVILYDQNLKLWVESLDWLRENTPDLGIDINEIHDRPAPGESFQYPPEAYGVLSWWDYGHWIEVEGERPPVANPFQQNAPFASCWLMARSEARANELLVALRAGTFARPNDLACDQVQVTEPEEDPGHPVRYVMIDDEMAAGKYGAITVWAKFNEFGKVAKFRVQDGREVELYWNGDPYYDTMLSRLYVDDAEGLGTYRLVHETKTAALIGSVARVTEEGARVSRFNDVLNRQTWRPEDFDGYNSFPRGELEPAGGSDHIYDFKLASSVKTFEHVEGALLEGSGAPASATVTVRVPLKSETTGREWDYTTSATADAQGRFSVRVPYSTTDYLTPEEGGTNLVVKATGPAQVMAQGATATEVHVPDRAVLEGLAVPVALA